MGDGGAIGRVDTDINSQLKERADVAPQLGQEVYQRKADSSNPPVRGRRVLELAPEIVVDESYIAPPAAGMGSLADQAGLHGVDAGHAPSPTEVQPPVTAEDPAAPPPELPVVLPPAPTNPGDLPGNGVSPAPANPTELPGNGAPPAAETVPAPSDPAPTVPGGEQNGNSAPNRNGNPEQNSNPNPGTNGENGKPWRKGYGEVAPGFKEPGETRPPAGVSSEPTNRQGSDGVPRSSTGATTGDAERSSMRQIVDQKRNLAEYSLEKHSGFWGNELYGGLGAFASGGHLARALDYGTKKILASGETDPAKAAGLADRLAIFYQQRFGLADNRDLLLPLLTKDRDLMELIMSKADTLDETKARIEQDAIAKRLETLLPEEKTALGRYRFFTGAAAQFEFEPPKADVDLVARMSDLDDAIQPLQSELAAANYDPKSLESMRQQAAENDLKFNKIVQGLHEEGPLLVDKYTRAAEAGLTAEEQIVANRFRFFTDYLKDQNLKPHQYGLTLTPEELILLGDKAEVQKLLETVEGPGKAAVEKSVKAAESALTPDQLKSMRRYQFFTALTDNPKLEAKAFGLVLDSEESALVRLRELLKDKDHGLPRMEALQEKYLRINTLATEYGLLDRQRVDLLAKLEKESAIAREKVGKPLIEFVSDADKKLIARYEYLKNGASGPIPEGVVLDADEAKLVAKHQALTSRMTLADPTSSPIRASLMAERDLLGKQILVIADELKPQVESIAEKIAGRPVTERLVNGIMTSEKVAVDTVLTAEELKVWRRYEFLKAGGLGAMPEGGVLTKAEETIVRRMSIVERDLSYLAKQDARAATTWLPKLSPEGVKLSEGHFSNFARGFATVAAADFLADRVDNMNLWGHSHRGTTPYARALAPWVGLAVPGGWMKKGAAVTGLQIAGGMLEGAYPVDPTSKWNRLLRPDGVDALTLGITSAIPMRSESFRGRLALMAMGLGVEKGLKLFFEGPSGREVRDQAKEQVRQDQSERTANSMNQSIDKLKQLDNYPLKGDARTKRPMTALEYYLAEQLSSRPENAIAGGRSAAVYLAACGEARLAKGTMVAPGEGGAGSSKLTQLWNAISSSFTHGQDRQFDYILPGANLDLGGRAMTYLEGAKKTIEQVKSDTQTLLDGDPNATVDGKKVDKAEIGDLSAVEQRVGADLELIYGRHDIPAIYKDMVDFTGNLNQRTVARVKDQIQEKLKNPGSTDTRYLAKLNRDLALLYLVFADTKVNPSTTGFGRDGASADASRKEALRWLKKARELDANNQDLPQLEQIAKQMGGDVSAAIKEQGNSPTSNPLGVPNWR
jgi:hypothetical protein